MSEIGSKHCVIPISVEEIIFECGHKGSRIYDHEIFGVRFELLPEILERRDRCGQCLLDEITTTLTQCSVCRKPILKGEDCLNYKGKIICMSQNCSIGPMGIDPGVWNGEQWVHGFQARTMKVF